MAAFVRLREKKLWKSTEFLSVSSHRSVSQCTLDSKIFFSDQLITLYFDCEGQICFCKRGTVFQLKRPLLALTGPSDNFVNCFTFYWISISRSKCPFNSPLDTPSIDGFLFAWYGVCIVCCVHFHSVSGSGVCLRCVAPSGYWSLCFIMYSDNLYFSL